MPRFIAVLVCLAVGFAAQAAFGAEVITAFDSAVRIDSSGELTVTETITVNAENDQIRRGIYRDFPTTRGRTALGKFRVGFEVVAVSRDGQPEKWFTEGIADGVRVYMGEKDVVLSRGAHTFVLTYKTDRQIGFFEDHDELYWNVTGNFWAFPITRARATITLPGAAKVKETAAYTGRIGATQTAADIKTSAGEATYVSTRALAPGEGLTAVVTWDKGFVAPPTRRQSVIWNIRDNIGFFTVAGGLLLVTAYYLLTWLNYGRDPDAGTIVAEYDPPRGLSPAACRYILKMDWDEKAFTSAVMNMAARGFLRMEKLSDGVFTLTKTGSVEAAQALSKGELKISHHLFGSWDSVALRPDRHKEIGGAVKALRAALEQEHDHVHLLQNSGVLKIGGALSLATLVLAALAGPDIHGEMILGLGVSAVVWFVYVLIKRTSLVVREGGAIIKTLWLILLPLLASSGLSLLQYAGDLPGALESLIAEAGITSWGAVVALALVNLIFFEIMKAPTARGRRLMDHIEGFKHYLTVAEKDRLNFHNPPALTPARFETYLPYAVALNVENDWGDQFHAAMARAAREQGTAWNQDAYSPSWYSGKKGGWFGRGSSWSSVSSAFGSSVSSASAAPSQASGIQSGGSGGGGFSGGGGGGGGGGGW